MKQKREGIGRPPIPIDEARLETMLQYGAIQWEVAAQFHCSEDTISRYIEEHYGMSFADLRQQEFSGTQLRLKQAQIRVALGSSVRKTIYLKRRVRRTGIDENGKKYTDTYDEVIPQTIDEEIAPDSKMLMWLGKQLLGQSEEAKMDQDLEKLRERFERPTVQINVQNADGTTIQQLEHQWSDQDKLPWNENQKPTNEVAKSEVPEEDDLSDLFDEADDQHKP